MLGGQGQVLCVPRWVKASRYVFEQGQGGEDVTRLLRGRISSAGYQIGAVGACAMK